MFALVVILLAGCGAGGHGAETNSEKASDAAILNTALGGELTAATAYSRAAPLLGARYRRLAREFQAQAQEYVDALSKAIRGVGGEVSAEEESIDLSNVSDRRSALELLYQLESRALASDLAAASHTSTPAPGALLTALAVAHGEHLVALRLAFGQNLPAAVAEAFDTGKIPPPGGESRSPSADEAPAPAPAAGPTGKR